MDWQRNDPMVDLCPRGPQTSSCQVWLLWTDRLDPGWRPNCTGGWPATVLAVVLWRGAAPLTAQWYGGAQMPECFEHWLSRSQVAAPCIAGTRTGRPTLGRSK